MKILGIGNAIVDVICKVEETFITKNIVSAAYKISKGELKFLEVGNLNSKRDWGYAPDYIDGIWKMMQQKNADDFVLATGRTYTVRDFIERTFKHLNINIKYMYVCKCIVLYPYISYTYIQIVSDI